MTETERKVATSSTLDLPRALGGKPQECLVLQVYGISTPSQEFKDRLIGTIQRKLDAAALEIMCNLYSRNQQLKLTPEDVLFLQPTRKPSHTLYLALPSWIQGEYRDVAFFYFLQILSTVTRKPMYTHRPEHCSLQAHEELQEAYSAVSNNVPLPSTTLQQDHIFLYIRPQHKGRGMAVLCVSLTDHNDTVVAPLPVVTLPLTSTMAMAPQSLAEVECAVKEEFIPTGNYSIKLHIWEKGNIGLDEFMQKLSQSFKHSLLDYYLELCLLPSPVAKVESEASPYVSSEEEPPYSPIKASPFIQTTSTPRKRLSMVSFRSLDLSNYGSEAGSRRGSEAYGPESRRGSSKLSDGSRKSSAYSERLSGHAERTLEALSHLRVEEIQQQQHSSDPSPLAEVEEETESHASSSLKAEQDTQSLWLQREKQRRNDEAVQVLIREAALGKSGLLSETYTETLPLHLTLAHSQGTPSVKHLSLPLMGHYSAKVFISQVVTSLQLVCPELSSDVFQLSSDLLHHHFAPQKDWTAVHKSETVGSLCPTSYFLLSRHLPQWEECVGVTGSRHVHSSASTDKGQLFSALDSRSHSSDTPPPLCAITRTREVWIPRVRLILVRVANQKVRPNFPCS